jgi:mannose-6-phosphate isomerase-like protein (cupin superfamily)
MEQVKKTWGWEKWFANTDAYCGKEIFVRKDKWSSNGKYHYHKIKDETFYVTRGILRLDMFMEGNDFPTTFTLEKGDSMRVVPGIRHRFTAMNIMGCHFMEASTTHREEDSYRCVWHDIRKEWVEI